MSWFRTKQQETATQEFESNSRIEIIAHKKATKSQINEVKKANETLNNVLDSNGFTLKIFLAAGGKLKNPKQRT